MNQAAFLYLTGLVNREGALEPTRRNGETLSTESLYILPGSPCDIIYKCVI